jgi:large subunit ribosomal protein L10
MDRAQKAAAVAALKATFDEVSVVVVTRNLGLTVAQSTDLRGRMREAGADYKVAKNTLTLIAAEGTKYQPISDLLTGPTALATSRDRSPPPRWRWTSPRLPTSSRSSAARWAPPCWTSTE